MTDKNNWLPRKMAPKDETEFLAAECDPHSSEDWVYYVCSWDRHENDFVPSYGVKFWQNFLTGCHCPNRPFWKM